MIVRKIIYSILNLFDHRKEKIPNLFLQKFKKHTHLSRKDKHRIRVCINEIIRYLGLIDHLIELGSEKKIRHVNPKIRNVLRLGIYELVFDDMTPEFAAIHSNVELAKKNINKKSSSMVNAVMRNIQRLSQKNSNWKTSLIKHKIDLAYPKWLLKKWEVEFISISESDLEGYKEVIMRIIGGGAYSRLKFESGVHRVQRVPETESQGRIHTSACTVAVLPEAEEVNEVTINTADLRIDTFRASGAGGQHVNKTDSAIRITHLPTNTVVECQDERSQHKNKARAMSLLQARLLDTERNQQQNEQAENRRDLVGSGDRSERIRTYNFPQGRITDHRINLTLYKLDDFLEGNIDVVIDPLVNEYQADLLASINE